MRGMHPLLVAALVLSVVVAGCPGLPTGERGPGGKHEAYLTGGGVLLLEIDATPGAAPSAKVQAALREQLGRITQKTIEIDVSTELPARGEDHTYTVDELRSLHERHQDEQDRSGVVVMHALFVDGRVQNSNIAGLAFLEDTFAIAMGTMKQNTCRDGGGLTCLGQPELSNAVRATAVHEAGHLFGLVNLGLPMVTDHEDDDSPGHSDNPNSVMYFEVETATGLQNLFTGGEQIPYRFDAKDVQDARAIQS